MSDFYVDPKGLEEDVKEYTTVVEAVEALEIDLSLEQLDLKSIHKFKESVDKLKKTIERFVVLSKADIANLELIKGEWLGIDEKMASQLTPPAANYSGGGGGGAR